MVKGSNVHGNENHMVRRYNSFINHDNINLITFLLPKNILTNITSLVKFYGSTITYSWLLSWLLRVKSLNFSSTTSFDAILENDERLQIKLLTCAIDRSVAFCVNLSFRRRAITQSVVSVHLNTALVRGLDVYLVSYTVVSPDLHEKQSVTRQSPLSIYLYLLHTGNWFKLNITRRFPYNSYEICIHSIYMCADHTQVNINLYRSSVLQCLLIMFILGFDK